MPITDAEKIVNLEDLAAFKNKIATDLEIVSEGSSEGRTLPERFADVINVKDYGAKGDGATDDTAAIQSALSASVATHKAVFFPSSYSCVVSKLTIPDNVIVIFNGAELIHDGSSYFNSEYTDVHAVINIGNNVTIDFVKIVFPSSQTAGLSGAMLGIYVAGDNFKADELIFEYNPDTVIADPGIGVANTHGLSCYGIWIDANNSDIQSVISKNIHRPVAYGIVNSVSGFRLGSYKISGYRRALKFHNASDGFVGSGIAHLRAANSGTVQNGWNGILFEQAQDIVFAPCEIDDAPEHGIRFGGKWNKNIAFSDVVLRRSGGSAIKLNSHSDSGVLQPNKNISFGDVTVYDNVYKASQDDITLTRKGETIRLSHADSVSFSSLSCYADVAQFSGNVVIMLNDSSNICFGAVHAEKYSSGFFSIDETNDVAEGDDLSDFIVSDVFVMNCNIDDSSATSNFLSTFAVTQSSIQNVLVDINAKEITRRFIDIPYETTGTVSNINYIGNLLSGGITYDLDSYHLDAVSFNFVIQGRLKNFFGNARLTALHSFVNSTTFDPSVDAVNGGLFISEANSSSIYGGAIVFGKVGSGARRGSAISAVKTGSNTKDSGLGIFTGSSTTANNALLRSFIFDHAGAFRPNSNATGSIGSSDYHWIEGYIDNLANSGVTLNNVNRSLADRFSDVVSVKDFGAVGDGVTDDATAFSAAVTASSGAGVFIPAGTYVVDSNVTGNFFSFGGVTFAGSGTVSTVKNLIA